MEYETICATGSVWINFETEGDRIVTVLTDLRAAGSMGRGIVVSRGRKRHGSYEEAKAAGLAAVEKLLGPPPWKYNSR